MHHTMFIVLSGFMNTYLKWHATERNKNSITGYGYNPQLLIKKLEKEDTLQKFERLQSLYPMAHDTCMVSAFLSLNVMSFPLVACF